MDGDNVEENAVYAYNVHFSGLKDLLDAVSGVIAHVNGDHYVLVIAADDDTVTFVEDNRRVEVSTDYFINTCGWWVNILSEV